MVVVTGGLVVVVTGGLVVDVIGGLVVVVGGLVVDCCTVALHLLVQVVSQFLHLCLAASPS